MSGYEPSATEVGLTLLLGQTLAVPFYQRFVRRLPLQGNERVLDFGTGSGVCSKHLARRLKDGGQLTCFDVSQGWQAVARRTLARYANVSFVCGSLEDAPLPQRSFDAVFIHFVLHDIPADERVRTIVQLSRTLKRGGQVFIREPLGRGAPDAAQLRLWFQSAGLRECDTWSETHWYTGPIYAGIYQKLA